MPSALPDPQTPQAPPHSAGALWQHLLDRVQRPEAPSPPGWHWHAGTGWALGDAWPAAPRALFDLFKPLLDLQARTQRWVVAQLGQSLDACVATRSGESRFINGPENIVHLHRLRALSNAVLIGAGSIAADNPQLTTRRAPGPSPTRVVLDPGLRLESLVSTAQVFTDHTVPTLWLCDARWRSRAEALAGPQRTLAVEGLLREDGAPELARAIDALRARGLARIFVEGGGVTVSRFVAQRCLDRLHLAVAPLIIGNGRPGLRFDGAQRLADCARPDHRVHRMGVDQLWDLDLRS